MKVVNFRLIMIVLAALALNACTNKKLENNIKSLERRVAALEGKSPSTAAPAATPVSSTTTVTNDIDPAEAPVMTFDNSEYDFGTISEGEIVDHTFQFTNTGNTPLVISKATATCGCTVPSWPKEPVAVGARGEIKVKFNSKNKKNKQTLSVNINANTKPELTRLKITGNVIPKVEPNS